MGVLSAPTSEQKDFIRTAVKRDLRLICSAWSVALGESESISFGTAGDGGGGAPSDEAEMTFRSRNAENWIAEVKPTLALLLKLADGSVPGERTWTGPFDPPKLVGSFCAAADDLVDVWPMRIDRVWRKLSRLASIAAKHWPATPKKGQVVDGVKIGDRGNFTEMCTECGSSIGGNAADPVARIDGKPYHRKPCYNTVFVRTKRRAARTTTGESPAW